MALRLIKKTPGLFKYTVNLPARYQGGIWAQDKRFPTKLSKNITTVTKGICLCLRRRRRSPSVCKCFRDSAATCYEPKICRFLVYSAPEKESRTTDIFHMSLDQDFFRRLGVMLHRLVSSHDHRLFIDGAQRDTVPSQRWLHNLCSKA